MAQRHKSAIKRHRQNLKQAARNRSIRSRVRSAIRSLRETIEGSDGPKALAELPLTMKTIDKAATKGVLHRNTAARYVSRLRKQVAALAKAS
ncbi:MAG TPA: 30S ribosomal protein S20 [Terriglobales bacterium]|nr:30S ribosomal protein S20 [Terriglobales bacterium]